MNTYETQIEDLFGCCADVEITFETEAAEPPCQYSNGNHYPGCGAQINLLEVKVLSVTGAVITLNRDYLHTLSPFMTSQLDAEAEAFIRNEIEDGALRDSLLGVV